VGQNAPITLTTDFGTVDGYVAAMKGVLTSQAPGVPLLDLSHDLAPFDRMGAYMLYRNALPHFPAGTVHLFVVDPGVGTARRGLIVQARGQSLVGPDNGVLPALFPAAESTYFAIKTDIFPAVSNTFHGRDIFAPIAAKLIHGVRPETLAEAITDPERLSIPPASRVGNLVKGEVIHVDRFGNLITNVAGRPLNNSQDVAVSVNKNPVRFAKTFGDVNIGDPVAYWGSGGLLEIAVREGSALQRYGGKGLPVEVVKFA
jgi:S-adenosylmethionine hydrolase